MTDKPLLPTLDFARSTHTHARTHMRIHTRTHTHEVIRSGRRHGNKTFSEENSCSICFLVLFTFHHMRIPQSSNREQTSILLLDHRLPNLQSLENSSLWIRNDTTQVCCCAALNQKIMSPQPKRHHLPTDDGSHDAKDGGAVSALVLLFHSSSFLG